MTLQLPSPHVSGLGIRCGVGGGRLAALALTVVLMLAGVVPAPALAITNDWAFEAGIASAKMSRGVDISYQEPSVSAAANWYPNSDIFAAASVATYRMGNTVTGVESVDNLGYRWRLRSDWSAQAMYSHYQFLRAPQAAHMNYDELVLTAGWHDAVYASVAVSPNTAFGPSPRALALAYDLVGRLPLVGGWTASAGIGYYDLHQQLDIGYVYGNAALTYQCRAWQFDVGYYMTNGVARATLGHAASNRLVADVVRHF